MPKAGKNVEKAIKSLDKAEDLIRDVRTQLDNFALAVPDQESQPATTADAMADSLTSVLNELDIVVNTLQKTLKYIKDAANAVHGEKPGGKPPSSQMPA